MTLNELRELARHAAHGTAPAEFSVSSVDAAVAEGFKNLTGSINNFMKNRYDIYDIIIENADDVVPAKVMDAMGQFAEVIQLKNGEKKLFKRGGLGRNRAKKFLTQVGLNGLYETFRLDQETFTIGMKSIGGAITLPGQCLLGYQLHFTFFLLRLTLLHSLNLKHIVVSCACLLSQGP